MNKGPVEAAKDAVKSVDRTVSQGAVKGIEKGGTSCKLLRSEIYAELIRFTEEAVDAAKKAAGIGADKAQEAAGEVKDKAQEAKGETKSKI